MNIHDYDKENVLYAVHNHNLNIHYTAPKEIWEKLQKLYQEMPHWKENYGETDATWYAEGDGKLIEACVDPSGLFFYAELPQEEWDLWFDLFKKRATEILGFAVGEPEDGFPFIIWE